ncbi:MAG: DNA internalization-related competence protein ComEC/Rec2 [Roseburia sp.]
MHSPPRGERQCANGKFYLVLICTYIAVLLGYYRCDCEERIRGAYESCLEDGACIQLQGRIYKKENKNQQHLFYLDHVILRVDGEIFPTHSTIVTFSDDEYPIGKTITISGTLKLPVPAANDGNYDARAYYRSLNIDYLVNGETVLGVYGKTDRVSEYLYQLREKFKENFIKIFSVENAGILTTMLLGDKELLDTETKEIYQQSGVSHTLTISGLHITLLGMLIYQFLRRKTSFLVSGMGAAIVLVLYVNMAGAGISARRALCMFLLLILGRIMGRSYDSLTGLALAVLLLLWENPFLWFYSGLQFSIAAVIGATYVRERLGRILHLWKSWGKKLGKFTNLRKLWSKKLGESLLVSVSIQLTTLPLVAFYYYEVPVYGVLLNLIVVNFLSFVLILGIISGVLGFVSLSIARIVAVPLELVLHGITGISHSFLLLPGAVCATGCPDPGRIMAYYCTLFLALQILGQLWRGYEERREKIRDKEQLKRENKIFYRRLFTGGCITLGILLAVLLFPVRSSLLCAVLDVGQGDGIYLQPEEGVHVFIDGGSSDVSGVAKYRILPFLKYHRITSIDYWFVSHYDTDHVSGLLQLLEEGYSVENLFLPYEEPDNENYVQLLEAAENVGTRVLYFPAGSVIDMESSSIRALLPDPSRSVDAGDENENCMVLYVTHPSGNMIFTGDAGVEDEQWILPDLSTVKLLKVGHHGSRYSSSEEFLQKLSPEYAVISCSSTNSYGHPHAETLERLDDVGCKVFRTDQAGQISISVDKAENSWDVEGKN